MGEGQKQHSKCPWEATEEEQKKEQTEEEQTEQTESDGGLYFNG